MRISDWSSDVCSSDLACVHGRLRGGDADCDAFIAESLVAAVARPYGEPDEARVKRTGAFHAICRCIGGKRFAVLRPDGTLDETPDLVIRDCNPGPQSMRPHRARRYSPPRLPPASDAGGCAVRTAFPAAAAAPG